MATYTSNYGWTKPSGSDNVDISVLNDNLDDQDSTIHDAFLNMAPPFSESSTYAVDDIVLFTTGLYKCHTAVVTPGSWTGSTNWQVYKLSEGGSGGGGTSNYNQLSNKPQINSVELSGNKTSSQLGLMASDGVVANPTGQTTGTLTALEVGGTKYAVPSGGTSDYTDLSNKPQVNGVELSGNKTASQLGMANSNTFQGTIAEWNQLSTAEKKAYDHASIPDSIDGGVTFPANKVVMTGGGNVEDAVDEVKSGLNNAKNIIVTGHIPAEGGYAIWNTTGIDFTNRYPVAFYVYNGGEPFLVSQGVTGFSVGMNSVSHVPIIFLGSDADASWKNQDCLAVCAKAD